MDDIRKQTSSETPNVAPSVHVIIIDDVCRFAHHLARYLFFELGFGIGRIPWDGNFKSSAGTEVQQNFFWDWSCLEPRRNISADGMVYLWWVPAVDTFEGLKALSGLAWVTCLEKVLTEIRKVNSEVYGTEKIDSKYIVPVIDFRGRLDSKSSRSKYNPGKALWVLKRFLNDENAHALGTGSGKDGHQNTLDKEKFSDRNDLESLNINLFIISSYVVGKKNLNIEAPDSVKNDIEQSGQKIESSVVSYRVYPKSPVTFRLIQKRVFEIYEEKVNELRKNLELEHFDKKRSLGDSKIVRLCCSSGSDVSPQQHYLITGAGFEVRSDSQTHLIGLDFTAKIMKKMGHPFRSKNIGFNISNGLSSLDKFERDLKLDFFLDNQDNKLPKFSFSYGDKHVDDLTYAEIKKLMQQDLDLWWDIALWEAIAHKVSPLATDWHQVLKEGGPRHVGRSNVVSKDNRLESQIDSIEIEYRMRDAFRKVLLDYDFGYIRHYLMASSLKWDCWLTTNYTRFADRSITLMERYLSRNSVFLDEFNELKDFWRFGNRRMKDLKVSYNSGPESDRKLWRIIGTSNAAERLMMGHLHKYNFDEVVNRRYLFKLHGDIGQLHTMAIAGYDKEPFSPLSMNIDSMNKIYIAAQTYINQKAQNSTKKTIIWHVIGHGLYDRLLTGLIAKVRDVEKHIFILVNPTCKGAESMYSKLGESMQFTGENNLGGSPKPRAILVYLTAAEYISKLWMLSNQLAVPDYEIIEKILPPDKFRRHGPPDWEIN